MNLTDLRVFAAVARHPSLGAAAHDLHLTPSAVSKALRRLEDSLDVTLFDRAARQLALNENGRRLLERAQALLALAEQTRADLRGERARVVCRIGGPAVLLWRHAAAFGTALAGYRDARLEAQAMYEDDALAALARGELQAALVTGSALQGARDAARFESASLGALTLQLVAGAAHPLAAGRRGAGGRGVVRTDARTVLAHPFVSPARALFCGAERGARSDGWRDDVLPRTIRWWTDDLQVLLALVRSGAALAYLPDFAAAESGIVRVQVSDCGFSCSEQVRLVWQGASAPDWLRALAAALRPA